VIAALIVGHGRHKEFDSFRWAGRPPDPHDEETFLQSKLRRDEIDDMRSLYKDLLRIRASTPALRSLDLSEVETHADDEQRTLLVKRGDTLLALNFSDESRSIDLPFGDVRWTPVIETGARIEESVLTMEAASFALLRC
jgi:maltooligosyltrehalose trehalohydrolase